MRPIIVFFATLLPLCAQQPDYATFGALAFRSGFPVVEMARWRNRFLTAGGSVNRFFHRRDALDPLSGEALPNADALYSSAWLDLRAGPITLKVPELGSRYVVLQLIDAWTATFAVYHGAELGPEATTLYLTPPGWSGKVPAGMRRVDCPTALVVLWLRIFAGGEGEIPALRQLQDRFILTAPPAAPPARVPFPGGFLEELCGLLPWNPPPAALRPDFDKLAPLGVRLGGNCSAAGLTEDARREADAAMDRSHRALPDAVRQPRWIDGGWAWFDAGPAAPRTVDERILRARAGAGAFAALPAAESMYAIGFADSDGQPLLGDRGYEILLDSSGLPPADGFWSITVYTAAGRPVPRARHSVNSATPGLVKEHGVIRITLGPSIALGQQSHWLPTRPGEGVRVVLRIYQPRAEARNRSWHAPLIVRVKD